MGRISDRLSLVFLSRTIIFLVVVNISSSLAHLQLSPDSELSYDEEYKLFQAEEDDSEETAHSHLSRHKRFVYLNVDTNMAVALLIGVPLSFVLPSMSNLFNSWRKKRSIQDNTAENSWVDYGHNVAKPEMEKVYTYFQLLDIPEASCQMRAVCEFSAEPEKFYPLSDVILQRIRNPGLPSLDYNDGKRPSDAKLSNSSYLLMDEHKPQKKSLFELYNEAADEGQVYGNDKCQQKFANTCHYPTEKLLNMPVIKFWSALQTLLNLSFKDSSFKS